MVFIKLTQFEKAGSFDFQKLEIDLIFAIFKFWLLENGRNLIFKEKNQLNLVKIKVEQQK